MMVMFGQLKVGGGLYVLTYSSAMVWTALLSVFLLGKKLHYQQWMGVIEVWAVGHVEGDDSKPQRTAIFCNEPQP